MKKTGILVIGAYLMVGLAVSATAAPRPMKQVEVNGAQLEYETVGRGEPVLFIHGSILADAFLPLRTEPALRRYRQIHYHRRGFAGSDQARPPFAIADQAADARALLARLRAPSAHVVGHSYGAVIALQLALDAPDAVRSLVLLEPPLVA